MTAQTRSTVGRGTRVAEVLLGIGCAVVGLLPWLLSGMELPLQNLWADDTMIEQMPRVLLPFNQYYVAMLVSLLGFGAAFAGLVARMLVARRDRRSALQVIGGMLLVQLIALAQTVAVVQGGLREGTDSRIYLVGVTGIVLLAMLVGLLASVLIALAPVPGALLGLTLGALTVTWWASPLVAAVIGQDALALGVQPLLAPVLVGIAIAWCGMVGAARVTAVITSLALLWVLPSALAGLQYALASRAMLRLPRELAQSAASESWTVLTGPALHGVEIAIVVALLALVARALLARRAQTAR